MSKRAFSASKIGILTGSAMTVLAALSSASPQTAQTPVIFHHWPHLAAVAGTDDDASPDIFHHWPHVALASAADDQDAIPDIFHHWPHFA